MRERYLLYNKETGNILSCGNVNKERDEQWIKGGDKSTTYGMIQKRLEETTVDVLYQPFCAEIEDTKNKKIINKEIVYKSDKDLLREIKDTKTKGLKIEKARLEDLLNAQKNLDKINAELKSL